MDQLFLDFSGQTLGFYVPLNLTIRFANEGRIYAISSGWHYSIITPEWVKFRKISFKVTFGPPRHDVQESTSQFIIEQDFDNGSLTYAYNDNKRSFYRDATSFSEEASGVR